MGSCALNITGPECQAWISCPGNGRCFPKSEPRGSLTCFSQANFAHTKPQAVTFNDTGLSKGPDSIFTKSCFNQCRNEKPRAFLLPVKLSSQQQMPARGSHLTNNGCTSFMKLINT